jgi:molecular chaperone GrpE
MSQKKSLTDRISTFFYGTSSPPINELALHKKLDTILAGLNHRETSAVTGTPPATDDLAEQVRKLAKTQFKTNTMQEKQLTQQEAALENLQAALERLQTQHAEQVQQAVETARLELLKSLLPSLDSLDAAFETGRRQVLKQHLPPQSRRAMVAWLDGVRLARLRLLDVLAAHQITRILTVGQPFDPHLHVAVATDSSGKAPDGLIVGEDRAGYTAPHKVLRFAEVVVSRQ